MAQLGFGDRAKKSARCPFHEDSSASFSLYVGDDGEERWKCFAGCGQGDAIDFLGKHRSLSNADACREYIRLAGVTPSRSQPSTQNSQPPFDWPACVAALTPEHRAKLAEWRCYTPEFVDWLHALNLIGLFDSERIAFAVHDAQSNVIGCHYRRKEDETWRYHPTGTRTAPLIIGNVATAKTVFAFESQWDFCAVADKLGWHVTMPAETVAVITRGSENGKLIAGLCEPEAVVCAFGQNDEPNPKTGTRAGEKWLTDVAAHCGCKCVHVVTPQAHEDANDWTRAGATADEIRRATAEAQLVTVSTAPDLHAAQPRNVSKSIITLPLEDEEAHSDTPKPFPVESLPPALASFVVAVARCERVPAALPAVCALGVASAAIGAGLEIVSASDRVTRANLFVLADAESGSGKSQVFRRIAEPIIGHQHQLHETHRQKTAHDLDSEIGLLIREIKRTESRAARSNDPDERERLLGELKFKRARKAELEQKLTPPCAVCADVTSEKLAVLLAANRETLFSASPEARQIVDIVCGRYNSTKSTDEAIYLSGFSGDFLRVDRLGRDPLTLRRPCLSVLWLVQPDAMARLFETETLAQSGFLPRFLTCHTQATPKKIVEGESQAISDAVRAQWAGLIVNLLATYHAAEKPYRVEPSPEAKRLLDDFFNAIVDRRTGELADVGQFASRYGEQAWRVALTFHAALYGRDAHNHPLDAETAQSAITVVQWFIDAQLGVLARGRRQAAEKQEQEVLELIEANRQRKGRDFTDPRDLQQNHIVANADAGRALLERMEQAGLLAGEEIKPTGGGWTRRIYRAVRSPVPE